MIYGKEEERADFGPGRITRQYCYRWESTKYSNAGYSSIGHLRVCVNTDCISIVTGTQDMKPEVSIYSYSTR